VRACCRAMCAAEELVRSDPRAVSPDEYRRLFCSFIVRVSATISRPVGRRLTSLRSTSYLKSLDDLSTIKGRQPR
jgi:hypothetical protein